MGSSKKPSLTRDVIPARDALADVKTMREKPAGSQLAFGTLQQALPMDPQTAMLPRGTKSKRLRSPRPIAPS